MPRTERIQLQTLRFNRDEHAGRWRCDSGLRLVPAGAKVYPSSTTHEENAQLYRFFAAATTSQRYLRYNRVENNGRETERRRSPAIGRLGVAVVLTPSVPGNKSSPSFEEGDIAIETLVASRISQSSPIEDRRDSGSRPRKKQIELENDSTRQREAGPSSTIVGRRPLSWVDWWRNFNSAAQLPTASASSTLPNISRRAQEPLTNRNSFREKPA